MSRSTTSAFNAASDAVHIEEVFFLELQFKSGSVYLCTRELDLSWNGQTWLGKGRVGAIEVLQEAGELEAHGMAMTLSAIPAGMLSLALDPSEYKNRQCKLWYGLLDASLPSAITVVGDPVGPFLMRMDSLEFEVGDVGTLRLTAESRLADWQRPRVDRYNNASQQALYPGDKFFEFAEEMTDKILLW